MLRTTVADRLREAHEENGYLFPAYESYCFANVPDAVCSVLGADARRPLPDDVFQGVETDVDNVVLVLVDGYGFEHWRRDADDVPLLSRLTERGTVTPLTSVYPSETAAAITTVHTGRQPAEHGLLGWFQYHEALDELVQTLPFAALDGTPLDEVGDVAESWLFDAGPATVYERLGDAGVDSHVVVPEAIVSSAHSVSSLRGAETAGYGDVAELARELRRRVEAAERPTYLYGYVPHVDAAAHGSGTESAEYRAQLELVADRLRRELIENLDAAAAERTLLVVTADHGHVDTVPEENVDLGTLDGVAEHLRRGPDGDPVPAAGSPRNLQFRVRDGHVDPLRESLDAQLDCLALDRAEVAARDLFGDREASATFAAREPDLVAVHRDRGVWYDDELAHLDLIGMHGGLTPEEMLVPFAAARISELRA